MKLPPLDGLLVLDKPPGITSRAAVDRIIGSLPRSTRVGHTGTLDPLATGVLVLCLGAATRFTEYVQDMGKTYQTTLVLGARSDTDDADGAIAPALLHIPPDRIRVAEEVQYFIGAIDQVPPAYSAAKVDGRRAYAMARRGESVTLQPRRVHISAIAILDYAYPRLSLMVQCGKGTYIRALARDLGERLGCGAYVETLRRTRVGPFSASEAIALDSDAATIMGHILPTAAAVSELPRLTLKPEDVVAIRHGRAIPITRSGLAEDALAKDARIAVFDAAGALVAVARIDEVGAMLRPEKVLATRGE
jgi:tRNA pseudouridine55 synthase